jgi:hypothetical protein
MTEIGRPPGFHFYEMKPSLLFGNDVDLEPAAPPVTFKNTESFPGEPSRGHIFSFGTGLFIRNFRHL